MNLPNLTFTQKFTVILFHILLIALLVSSFYLMFEMFWKDFIFIWGVVLVLGIYVIYKFWNGLRNSWESKDVVRKSFWTMFIWILAILLISLGAIWFLIALFAGIA